MLHFTPQTHEEWRDTLAQQVLNIAHLNRSIYLHAKKHGQKQGGYAHLMATIEQQKEEVDFMKALLKLYDKFRSGC